MRGPHPARPGHGRQAPPRWSGFTPPKWYGFPPPLTDVLLGKGTCSCHSPGRSFSSSEYQTALRQLYELIRAEKPYFEERIDPRDLYKVFVVEPQQTPERIRAQSGAFLASAFHQRFERDHVQQWNERIPVYAHYRLTLQGHQKPQIMDDLRLMNISQETLFPGLDTSAKAVLDLHDQEAQRKRRSQAEWSLPIPEVGQDEDDMANSTE